MRRQELIRHFESVLGCGPVRSVEHSAIAEPVLLVRFPDGGRLSIEFDEQAPDDEQPRRGAWLEFRVEDPSALMRSVV